MVLRDACSANRRPDNSLVHEVLRCPAPLLLTTNYDTVIESVWKEVRREPLGVGREIPRSALQSGGGRHLLVKLHGDIEEPESCVLTRESYEQLLRTEEQRERWRVLLSARHMLFLGFGLDDLDFNYLMEQIRIEVGAGLHFAVLPSTTKHRAAEFERFGVQPLWYEVDDVGSHADAIRVLRDVMAAAGPRGPTRVVKADSARS
jgi:hypothetical protein